MHEKIPYKYVLITVLKIYVASDVCMLIYEKYIYEGSSTNIM